MRKNTFSNKLFLAFFVNLFLCLSVRATTISASLLDDVAAMVTNAKKMPHQIFIIDSSDSMNSFAYSDYIDTCRDGEANLDKAIALCKNAFQQCRNVESNAMCDVDLNCGEVSTKCGSLEDTKSDLHEHCKKIMEDTYKEPGRWDVVTDYSDSRAMTFVGPWDPKKTYKEDLCFYDWTADTNADAIEGTYAADNNELGSSAADAYNMSKLNMTQAEFDEFKKASGGFIADRRDWDCLTDGSDKMKVGDTSYSLSSLGVSGLWLNWKYTTSLDALKIILGNVHSFSVQPRYRGSNKCHKIEYKPAATYQKERMDADGNPIKDDEGHVITDTKHTCFISFEPTQSKIENETTRKNELEAIRDAIDAAWTSEMVKPTGNDSAGDSDEYAFVSDRCDDFSLLNVGEEDGFSIYTKEEYSTHVVASENVTGGCDKCMEWKSNPDGTGSFVETPCVKYSGSKVTPDPATLASFTGENNAFKMTKICCKATQCSNPRCRDNDVNCKKDQGTIGGNEVGYCASWTDTCEYQGGAAGCCDPDYTCVLEHYSEFDQDENHCCSELNCAEEGATQTYTDEHGKQCQRCSSGSVLGKNSQTKVSAAVTILGDPGTDIYCGDDGQDTCSGISVSVGIDAASAATIPYDSLDEIQITVYYGCLGDAGDPSNLLGSGTCDSETSCKSVVSGTLSGCNDKGYRMRAEATVKRNNCKLGDLTVSFELEYSFDDGYYKKNSVAKNVFNPATAFYQVFQQQTTSDTKKVFEYECKASFYNRELAVIDSSSCPSADDAPAYLNINRQGAPVEFCEARTLEREVLARDQWLNPTTVACSWLCRAAETYDDPWKCASFFYMMDEIDRNGVDICNAECSNAMTSVQEIESCCRCVNQEQGLFYHHQTPEGVDMSPYVSETPDPHPIGGKSKRPCTGNHCVCAVSGYQYAMSSDGGTTTASGYQAEIVNGHTQEGTTAGYYNLVPYNNFESQPDRINPDSPYNGWYRDYSLIYSENGSKYISDSLTSLFTTNDPAVRVPTCVYDVLWGWTGEDCNSCNTGCCAIDLSQDSNDCDYPMFWMKIPKGKGGRLLMEAADLTSTSNIDTFRSELKGIKARGGSTLGETLYDAWRYLGGMYALHDPNYINTLYNSPYENRAPECSSNEAIVISGGSPQFDHNFELNGKDGITCPEFSVTSGNADNPCVKTTQTSPTQHGPYEVQDWENSSLMNVAKFVNNPQHSFWDGSSDKACRNGNISENAAGCNPGTLTGANTPIIDRVHSIAIGEWGLSAMYDTLKKSGTGGYSGAFMKESFIKNVAQQTVGYDGVHGKYFGLTASPDKDTQGDENGGNFTTLTELFENFVNKSRDADVVAGRPHWTSSLVQTYDVEEKYRGPDAYVAGAIPIDGTVSRFWFGNLKKYNVDGGTICPIQDDSESDCGEWKKQSFSAQDCFAHDDSGSDFSGGESSIEQYKKLMIGGAAYKLKEKIEKVNCSGAPCYKSTERNIYYDTNVKGDMQLLSSAYISEGSKPFIYFEAGDKEGTITPPDVERILDYMTGYDGFEDFGPRTRHRYDPITDEDGNTVYDGTFKVDDPFNVDFNHGTKLTLRPLYLGAIVHSKPVAVLYDDENTPRIFAGANDGMLHAFDGEGNEVYAYMPTLAIPSIVNFKEENHNIFFNATVDGPITMLHIDQSHDGIINGGEKAYLIFGYRRGARGYTVIDISDKDHPKFVQNLNTDGGYSFGKAAVFRKCSGTCSFANDLKYYLVVPGGYDTCHDPTSLTSVDGTVKCGTSDIAGNNFTIFELDTNPSDGKPQFVEVVKFDSEVDSKRMSSFDKSWLVTSFASVPFVVNTSGKAAVNTEFIYINDLSGTVFRIDVTSDKTNDWTAKVVYTARDVKEDIQSVPWDSIGRSYVSSNFFPPLERYNPAKRTPTGDEDLLIPIPVVTGNAANPRYTATADALTVFYDKKNGENTPLFTSDFLPNQSGESHPGNNTMIEDKRGWRVVFDLNNGEKGITEPLIVYDIYGGGSDNANSYSIAWNTYIPMKRTECTTFGTSSNYERYVPDGNQYFEVTNKMLGSNGEWTVSADKAGKCKVQDNNISLATSVGIIATNEGYDLTFGAGADIFRKKQLTVKNNSTYIIKWYELY